MSSAQLQCEHATKNESVTYGAPLVAAKSSSFFFTTPSFRLLQSSAHRCQVIFSQRLFFKFKLLNLLLYNQIFILFITYI